MAAPATDPLATGRIGATGLIFFALAAAAPISFAATAIPAAYAPGTLLQVPLTHLVAAAVLLLFTVGYGAMVRRAPVTGGLYSVAARGLGRPGGVGAGGVALLAYTLLQAGLYAAIAVAAPTVLPVSVDPWVVAACCWAVVALCGLLRVDLAGAILALVVIAEVAVVLGYAVANLLEPAPSGIGWEALNPAGGVDRAAWGLLLVVAATGFAGFETAAAYAEETVRPRRAVRLAVALAGLTLALLYAVSAWATSVATGADLVVALSAGRGSELMFDLAAARLAPWAVTLGRVLLLTGLLAALISLHHTIARYVFAMARERVLLAGLARTTRGWQVPLPASLVASLLQGLLIGGVYASGRPPGDAARWLTAAGALGVLLLVLISALATLLFLNRVPGDENMWQRFGAPVLATVLIGVLVHLAGAHLPAVLGVADGHWLVFAVPGAYAAVLLLGISHGFLRKAIDPIAYAGIGLGGAAVIVPVSVPAQRTPGAHRPDRILPSYPKNS